MAAALRLLQELSRWSTALMPLGNMCAQMIVPGSTAAEPGLLVSPQFERCYSRVPGKAAAAAVCYLTLNHSLPAAGIQNEPCQQMSTPLSMHIVAIPQFLTTTLSSM